MQDFTTNSELPKSPETTPTWHQPTLTILEAGDAETNTATGTDGPLNS